MSILAVAELKGTELKKVSRELVSAGRKLGEPVVALLIGGTDDHATEEEALVLQPGESGDLSQRPTGASRCQSDTVG